MSSLESLSRRDLQTLAKKHGVRANMKSAKIIDQLKLVLDAAPPDTTPPSPESKARDSADVKWFIDGGNRFAIGIQLYEGGFPVVNGDTIRTYVKVYMHGLPHMGVKSATDIVCQLFYLSSGRNSSLGGVWLPSNVMSLRFDTESGKRKWSWYIQKKPWLIGSDGSDPAMRFGGDPCIAMVSLILGGFSIPLKDGGDACAIDRLKTYVVKTLKLHLLKVLGKKKGAQAYREMIEYYENMSVSINTYLLARRKEHRPCDDYDLDIWIEKCTSYNWFAPFDPAYPDYIPNLNPLDPGSLWSEIPPSEKLFLNHTWLDQPSKTMEYLKLSKQEELGFPDKTPLQKARMMGRLKLLRRQHTHLHWAQLPRLASREELLARGKK